MDCEPTQALRTKRSRTHGCAVELAARAGLLLLAACAGAGNGDPSSVEPPPSSLGAARIAPARQASTIAVGRRHACALAFGRVFCWGRGLEGQLGPPRADSREPREVLGIGGQVIAVTAGGDLTCALLGSGDLVCWGDFTPTTRERAARIQFDASVEAVGTRAFIAWGNHPCMVTGRGRVLCADHPSDRGPVTVEAWVLVGDEDPAALSAAATSVHAPPGSFTGICWVTGERRLRCSDTHKDPEAFAPAVIAAAVGAFHECVVAVGGDVFCRGFGERGELGRPLAKRYEPEFVAQPVPGVSGATTITAGRSHTCVILANGTVRCWGANDRGQCGVGASASSSPIEPVGIGVVSEVHATWDRTCARRSEAEVVCWGDREPAEPTVVRLPASG